jgi:glycosyltransferase involved in cell wall biosynthesis
MGSGKYQYDYFSTPKIEKSLEEIYADMNAYTCETMSHETDLHQHVEQWVILPPLYFEGRFIKGIVHGFGMDATVKQVPETRHYYHTLADSFWSCYPWTTATDALFGVYDNPHREAWFRNCFPDQAHKPILPFQYSDFVNETVMRPVPVPEKDIDILMVARRDPAKNFPFLARCLKTYRQKYPNCPIKLTIVDGFGTDANLQHDKQSQEIFREVESILVHPMDYLTFYSRFIPNEEMSGLYSRAKLVILGSLLEGKNRAIHEAMLCNTPIIVFKEFNQYIRGNTDVFPPGAGMYAPFDPEGWADTVYTALNHLGEFHPRKHYLSGFSGRKKSFNLCLNALSYYQENLPDFEPSDHTKNLWLDTAMLYNYQLSLKEFMHHPNQWLFPFRAHGIDHWKLVIEDCKKRFGSRT